MSENNGNDLYAQDGVNVALGDQLSRYAGRLCAETFENHPNIEVVDLSRGGFRGPRFFQVVDLPKGTGFHIAPDGIGTKTVITDAARLHEFSACDWVAMCGGDITRYGGCPALFSNVLDVSSFGEDVDTPTYRAATNLLKGLSKVCNDNGYVMYNGETAEMGVCVGTDNPDPLLPYIWSGTAFGFFHENNAITGERVRSDQVIVAFYEPGLRSNGGSSVRKAFKRHYGRNWPIKPLAEEMVMKAALPSKIYDPFLAHINGWKDPSLKPIIPISLLVHLTGGSFRGKFFDDFLKRHGFSAVLDDLFDPPEIMQRVGEWRGFDSEGFYETFHGGQGVLAVVEEAYVVELIRRAAAAGIRAKACGRILGREQRPELLIESKFRPGKQVVFS